MQTHIAGDLITRLVSLQVHPINKNVSLSKKAGLRSSTWSLSSEPGSFRWTERSQAFMPTFTMLIGSLRNQGNMQKQFTTPIRNGGDVWRRRSRLQQWRPVGATNQTNHQLLAV